MNRLLAIALVIVTLLPLAIFATDFTNSQVLRRDRSSAGPAARAGGTDASADPRRERRRVSRARIHITLPRVAMALGFQLVMLTAIGAVGRRLFALRL